MLIRRELRPENRVARWLIIGLWAAVGIGMLVASVVLPIEAVNLRDSGVRANALVQDMQQDGRYTHYELRFTLQDGMPYSTWTDDVQSGTRVGDTIQIAYQPGSPATVSDVRNLGRWWAGLIFAPMGIILLGLPWFLPWWLGQSINRAVRKSRYGR